MSDSKIDEAEVDKMLGRKDPYEFWIQEAGLHCAPLCALSPSEVLGTVQNAFSKDWLDQQIKAPEKGSSLESSRHPLARWILVAGKTQVLGMYELAIYLRHLHAVPRLSDVIQQMKEKDGFENTLLQLAYGFRLAKLGATSVSFEPDVDDGRKADIAFQYKGEPYLAECFKPDMADPWYMGFGELASKRIFEASKYKGTNVWLFSNWRNDPPFSKGVEKEFESDWRELIQKVESGGRQKISKANYDIEIQEISKLVPAEKEYLFKTTFDSATFIYAQRMMKKSDALAAMRGEEVEKEHRDMLFFKVQDEERSIEDLVGKLAKKVERKVAQLRKNGTNTKGILIVDTPLVHPRNFQAKPFQRFQGKVVDAHENVEAAAVVHKTHGSKGDPRFGGFILLSKREGMKPDLMAALEELEARGPLL